MSLTFMQPPSASMISTALVNRISQPPQARRNTDERPGAMQQPSHVPLIPLALVAHAHADVHQELEEAFVILEHVAAERRVIQRHGAVDQGPGGAVMKVRRHVFELALDDAALDELGQALEV